MIAAPSGPNELKQYQWITSVTLTLSFEFRLEIKFVDVKQESELVVEKNVFFIERD